ncbi:hypothetical protein [Pontibacter mangrovi]|uniref:Uncharacterized protein n=1 Tax=Pontibacter mangrovi TaxID=2589816 RepID=A0A501W139_9BACT|nr:hypothetical protein [Pontibacter mangrovi]TPE43703.1 hypothetical protein FJM65_13230 [Pontibacter mangrovi]
MMLLAGAAMFLQLGFLLHLTITKTFSTELVMVFLINLFVPAIFLYRLWLDRKPQYRRHLTLSAHGVRYRTRFMQPEHEFDWEEVDAVRVELFKVVFVLKNEEVHEISLERIQNDEMLQQVKEQVKMMVRQKDLQLH